MGSSPSQSAFVAHDGWQLPSFGKHESPALQSALLLHSTHWPTTQAGRAAPQSELVTHSTQPRLASQATLQVCPRSVQPLADPPPDPVPPPKTAPLSLQPAKTHTKPTKHQVKRMPFTEQARCRRVFPRVGPTQRVWTGNFLLTAG